jgi:hypothetical protein
MARSSCWLVLRREFSSSWRVHVRGTFEGRCILQAASFVRLLTAAFSNLHSVVAPTPQVQPRQCMRAGFLRARQGARLLYHGFCQPTVDPCHVQGFFEQGKVLGGGGDSDECLSRALTSTLNSCPNP